MEVSLMYNRINPGLAPRRRSNGHHGFRLPFEFWIHAGYYRLVPALDSFFQHRCVHSGRIVGHVVYLIGQVIQGRSLDDPSFFDFRTVVPGPFISFAVGILFRITERVANRPQPPPCVVKNQIAGNSRKSTVSSIRTACLHPIW